MNLIEKINVDGVDVSFYDGLDIDFVKKHPKDGSKGFLFCFIDSWFHTVKSHERESKVNAVLQNKSHKKFDSKTLENDFLAIYQLDGTEPGVIYKIVKEKVLNNNFMNPAYIPVSGLKKGVWKVGNSSNLN